MPIIEYTNGPKFTFRRDELIHHSFLQRRLIMLDSHLGTVVGEIKEILEIFYYIWRLKILLSIWIVVTALWPPTIIYTMWLTIVPAFLFLLKHFILVLSTFFGFFYIFIFGIAGWNWFYKSKYDEETFYDLIMIQ